MSKPVREVRARPQPRDEFLQFAIRIGLLAFLVYWSFAILQPFIPILVWGMVLTVALFPLYRWLAHKLGGRNAMSAAIITLLSFTVIVGPVAWLSLGLADSLRSISDQLMSAKLTLPEAPRSVRDWPIVGERIFDAWSLASSNLLSALEKVAPHVRPMAGHVLAMAGSAGIGLLKFLLSLLLMGFLFVPGPNLVHGARMFLMHIVPERSDEFLALAGSTIRTISRGVIGIAVMQALLAGVGFRLAGVPGGSILAFVVLVLGIVQIGGGIPIAGTIIWGWFGLDTTSAIFFTAYMIPVSLLDNILKPIVMAHGLKTPTLVIFLGVLGGTLLHGIVGLFVGPIILALGWELLVAWMRESTEVPDAEVRTPAQESAVGT